MSDDVIIERDEAVQIIRMNRPENKNALTGEMYGMMAEGLKEAYADDSVRAVLILGCPGVFSAGNDIRDFIQVAQSGDLTKTAVFDFLTQIVTAEKSLVAGVDGVAIGIGTTLLFHCDQVVASHKAKFKTPFVNLGLVPEAGSSLLAPRIIGHHKAFELLAMGKTFGAESAREAGIVNLVVTPDELEQSALAVAKTIASRPKEAMEITRKLLRGDRSDVLERMKEESKLFGERLASEEAKHAFMKFMRKER